MMSSCSHLVYLQHLDNCPVNDWYQMTHLELGLFLRSVTTLDPLVAAVGTHQNKRQSVCVSRVALEKHRLSVATVAAGPPRRPW